MNPDFKSCLDKKKLYRSEAAKPLAAKEFKSAGEDLAEAELSLSQRRYKWARHGRRESIFSDFIIFTSYFIEI
jgi:hypothetical protein